MNYKIHLRAALTQTNLPIIERINYLKQYVSAGEYAEALKLTPLFKNYLHKNPTFKSIDDIYQKEPYQFSGDLKKEFKWATLSLEPHLPLINDFNILKESFELNFLLNNLEHCEQILQNIRNIFGVSLWLFESEILIEEKLRGTEANWNKLSFYLSRIKNPYYEFMINSSSKRVESKLQYEAYTNQLINEIDSINGPVVIADFFIFRNINPGSFVFAYPNLEGIFYMSNLFSSIDQYLIIIDAIIYSISTNPENHKLYLPFIKHAKNIVKSDPRLNTILTLIGNNPEPLDFTENPILEALDCYYSGNFEQSLKISKASLGKYPTEFELYEIYAKSLLNMAREFETFSFNETINEKLLIVYNILTFKKSHFTEREKLLKIGLSLLNTSFGKKILAFLSEVEGKIGAEFLAASLSNIGYNPKITYFINKFPNLEKNFQNVFQRHSFKVLLYRQGVTVNFETLVSKNTDQSNILKAQHLFEKGDYQSVIKLLNTDIKLTPESYHYERNISLLFNSYLNLGDFNEALHIFGDVFFDESVITSKINYLELFEQTKLSKNTTCVNLIELPILHSIVTKEYSLYEIFDEFILSHNLNSLNEDEINYLLRVFDKKKVLFFLHNVVTIDTLKYSTDFQSINDVEEKRINILQYLKHIDTDNNDIYEKEIEDIYRINSVRKVLKEVDEGRLYIDVKNLKELQVNKFKEQYKRFKEIEIISKDNALISFNVSKVKNWEVEKGEVTEKHDSHDQADFIAFKNIYLDSRENFLFSNEYGLDSCLSTRIRHGALKNHIRSVFEKLDLVTSKLNDKYIDNQVWQNQLKWYPEVNHEVQIALKDFSRNIDDYTSYIVEKLIQIQTERSKNKDEGLFKFFTDDSILLKFYNQNKHLFDSIDSTIDLLLTSLVNHTIIYLQKNIKNTFTTEIATTFQSYIDDLISQLRLLNLPYGCQLIPNLIKSSTDLQNELENISYWFFLNTTSPSSLLSMETVINASKELTNKINPNRQIYPEIIRRCEDFAVYSNLIFVFNIIFNNIIQHSHLSIEDVKITITIDKTEDGKYFIIQITNNLSSVFDYSENKKKLQKIKDNWNNHEKIERSNKEGESGFEKIKRIMIYETFTKTDKFNFTFDTDKISIFLYFHVTKLDTNE